MATVHFRAMTPHELIDEFTASLPYKLDEFSLRRSRTCNQHSVLVRRPQAQQTVIGEFGIFMARKSGCARCTPRRSKRLSESEVPRLPRRWGDDQVGLLTGDIVVNRDAPVLVMPPRSCRNVLVTVGPSVRSGPIRTRRVTTSPGGRSTTWLHRLRRSVTTWAIRARTAWEESILLAPRHIPLVCLSATVPM